MSEKPFKALAAEAAESTKKGIDLLIEIDELQTALSLQSLSNDTESLIREMIEKEKLAVGFIQESMTIQKALMGRQHRAVQSLIERLG
ncbi:MAG TPA: hypothetical protein PLK77_03885 [Pyrinomonadaceae bacterium]|nr:hypothetical protein [Pyrinomonadaceae bacterium]